MIIAVPADIRDITSPIARRFGKAPYFVFYDSQQDTHTIKANPGLEWVGGGAVDVIVENNADVVIADQMGGYVLNTLRGKGIEVIYGKQGRVLDLILEYLCKK